MFTIGISMLRVNTFSGLDLGCESYSQQRAKPVGSIFLEYFSTDQDLIQFNMLFKWFRLNILILFQIESYLIKGNSCSSTDCVTEKQKKEKNPLFLAYVQIFMS